MIFCNFLFATNFGQICEGPPDLGFVQIKYCWKAYKINFTMVPNWHQSDF